MGRDEQRAQQALYKLCSSLASARKPSECSLAARMGGFGMDRA